MAVFTAKADLAHLPPIRDFVIAQARKSDIPISLEPKLDLVLEEVLVNVANYAYGGQPGPVEVECAMAAEAFCCTVRDRGVPFNPLDSKAVDTTADIDDRPVGGLGLMFVTTMADDCSYTRLNDTNALTFCFSL